VVSVYLYSAFILGLSIERGFELRLSARNAAWARAAGAVEYGRTHLRWMKALHTAFFIGCLSEVWLLSRPFLPAIGWPCLAIAVVAQGLRYWTITTLGRRWNVAVLVVPGVPAEAAGPFRYLKHPNYLAVIAEGLAVPLMHSAYLTALVFGVLNAWLLSVRIRCEESALRAHSDYEDRLGDRQRLWPTRSSKA
jgi:methyltransferase